MRMNFSRYNQSFGKVLLVVLVLVVLALGWLSWGVYSSYRMMNEIIGRDMKLVELNGQITYFDEVLTMSARMAAFSGDMKWEERYLAFVPPMDEAIGGVIAIAPAEIGSIADAETDTANQKLIEMETQAFDLAREGKLAEAQAILLGAEYAEQKQILGQSAEKMDEIIRFIHQKNRANQRAELIKTIFVLAVVAVSIIVLSYLIISFNRTLRHSSKLVNQVTENSLSFGSASSRLAAISEQTGQVVNQVTEAIQQIAVGTTRQTESTTKTVGSVRQLNQAIEGLARGVQEQSQAIGKTSDATQQLS